MARCIRGITIALVITGVKAVIAIIEVLLEEKNKDQKVDMLII